MHGLTFLVTPEAFEVRFPCVEWTRGAYGPVASSELWRRFTHAQVERKGVMKLLMEARKARAATFKRCKYCGGLFPPSRRDRDDVCHGCASEHEGVVF